MTETQEHQPLHSGAAIQDLGWFWNFFSSIVAGLSVLAILQMIFVEHRLIDALQWIVDGYNSVMTVLGGVIEPLVQPAIDWFNSRFHLSIELQPHWKPIFVLAMVPATSVARVWRGAVPVGNDNLKIKRSWPTLLFFMALSGAGVLVGALISGMLPLDGGWWSQGLAAAAPVLGIWLVCVLWALVVRPWQLLLRLLGFRKQTADTGKRAQESRAASIRMMLVWFLALPILILFALGAILSVLPGVGAGAGVLSLLLAVFLLGAFIVQYVGRMIWAFRRDEKLRQQRTEAINKILSHADATDELKQRARLELEHLRRMDELQKGGYGRDMRMVSHGLLRIGIVMLGGFLAAGAILAADAVVKGVV